MLMLELQIDIHIYTEPKKQDTRLLSVTLPNAN